MDMFQKLEKVLRKIHLIRKNKLFFIQLIFFLDVIHAQIDQRFDLFDWEIIRQNESINSISEGYQYIFFATDANGILRFNKFSRKFEPNLYLGQGIKSNKIKHIYFDKIQVKNSQEGWIHTTLARNKWLQDSECKPKLIPWDLHF